MNPVAFVVTIDLDPSVDPNSVADEIAASLSSAFNVIEVNPWDRPVTGPQPFTPPTSDFL